MIGILLLKQNDGLSVQGVAGYTIPITNFSPTKASFSRTSHASARGSTPGTLVSVNTRSCSLLKLGPRRT